MKAKYNEIRRDAFNTFRSLHDYGEYSVHDTFYVFIDDYVEYEEEETSAIISFCIILIKNKDRVECSKELQEYAQIIFNMEKMNQVLGELEAEDKEEFYSDLALLKDNVYQE